MIKPADRKRYYRILNLPTQPEPTQKDVEEAYQELRLAYEHRADNPVTHSDRHFKEYFAQVKQAYTELIYAGKIAPVKDFARQMYNFRMNLEQLLQLYYADRVHPKFQFLTTVKRKCGCKRICETCSAQDAATVCRTCNGKGWIHYCTRCGRTGYRVDERVVSLPLGIVSQEYLWLEPDLEVHLRITPSKNWSIRDNELIYTHILPLEQLMSNNLTRDRLAIRFSSTVTVVVDLDVIEGLSQMISVPLGLIKSYLV